MNSTESAERKEEPAESRRLFFLFLYAPVKRLLCYSVYGMIRFIPAWIWSVSRPLQSIIART